MQFGKQLTACLVLVAGASAMLAQIEIEKSTAGSKKVSVTLKNAAAKAVQYFWIDFDGKEVEYGKLAAGESKKIQTFDGHLWRFKLDGRPIGKYRASGTAEQVHEVRIGKGVDTPVPLPPGAVPPPPAAVKKAFNLSPFYQKYVSVKGLPVVSSAKVSDKALKEAAYLIGEMLINREDVIKELAKNKVRFAVMAPTEKTTDIPEHSDLTPKDYWDKRARGLGATRTRPAVSCGEENLLNLKGDPYNGENILIHEFAHAIHEMGLNSLDAKFDGRLEKVFTRAIDTGLWKKTYAATNKAEYWAEAVQSYFNANLANDSQHNDASTREKLAKYDPDVFALIDEAFKKPKWRYVRYDKRSGGGEPVAKTGTKVTMKIVNETGKQVAIYWMNNAKPEAYGTLKPGESRDQATFGGHQWQARIEGRKQPTTYTAPEKNDTWRVR